MRLEDLIDALEELRKALGGQAHVVLPHLVGAPLRAVQAVEAVQAAQIQPHAYAPLNGQVMRDTETVVVISSIS